MLPQLLPLAGLAATAAAHGYIASPPMRSPGAAATAACGPSVVQDIVRDKTSHVEGLPELAAKDAAYHADACNLWLCRGLQFADNVANVQAYKPGQSVNMKITLTIPHVGNANVSVVDTKTNAIIGKPLLDWPSGYADEKQFYAKTTPKNQTDFNVTIPEDLGNKCATAGACVLQWWWYGTGAKQSYESCVDFTVAAS
ncbi:hypothetical protein F5Y15DRAFT_417616 [Xylariaceae sp. FL0016]|nr:hypothetical protein F5Y15DRAFT_417616 [Xylariaceae sp. FL0016]